jgi:hypothetical protein
VAFGNERKADRFQRFEITSNRAGIFRVIVRHVVDKLSEASPWRAFQLAQEIPLTGDLIVSGHRNDIYNL